MDRIAVADKRYALYNLKSEAEFEEILSKRYKEVFWEDYPKATLIYLSVKKRIHSVSRQISVPDGILLWLGATIEDSQIYIVEYELKSHNVEHILNQLRRFKNAVDNVESRKIILDAVADEIDKSSEIHERWNGALPGIAHFKGCSDMLLKQIAVVVVVDEVSDSILELMRDISSYNWIGKDSLYLLEAKLYCQITPAVTKGLKKGSEVMALYPDGENQWFRATVRSLKQKGKFLVDWYDGDKTNRSVSTVCAVTEQLLLVKQHDLSNR